MSASAIQADDALAYGTEQTQFVDIRGLAQGALTEIKVSAASHYGDALWCFKQETGGHAVRDFQIRFDNMDMLDGTVLTTQENAQYLANFKAFAYTMIASPPPSRPKLTTTLKYLGHGPLLLLRFMHQQRIGHFDEVTEADMQRFLSWCATLPNQNNPAAAISNATLETRISGLWWLHAQRDKMPRGLQVNPWRDQTSQAWASQAAVTQAHGRTQEMPDEVAQALVMQAMTVIRQAPAHAQAARAYATRKKTRRYSPFNWPQYGFQNHFDWNAFPSQVTMAGYILIALFSGMRVDEIVSLQLSYTDKNSNEKLPCTFCKEIEVDGLIRTCYFVRGYTKKLEKEPRLTQWQVAPIVHEAVDAIIAMRSAYRRHGNAYLFATRTSTSITARMFENSINSGLRSFAKRYDIRWQGQIWHLATHQFRKKFARMMTRQGMGLRDIQDQLKHLDIEMTKRYGHMDLYHELQMERFSLSKEQYEELLRSSRPILGGGAQLMNAMRTEFIGKTRDDQDAFLTALTKNALIDAVDFGLCLYNPARAQCGGNKFNCQPADCLNSVIPLDTAARHLISRQERNEHLLQQVKSPLARAHILAQQTTTLRLLDQAQAQGVSIAGDLPTQATRNR